MAVSTLNDLKEHPSLKPYVLEGFVRTKRKLGTGAFGVVEELTAGGTHYAAKRLHDFILDSQDKGSLAMVKRFARECKLMSEVRHPNIVQFIGLFFDKENPYPMLVMEQLSTSLDSFLQQSEYSIPFSVKLNILYDVVKGLLYLHERKPPIVHRDLTAQNILLNTSSMDAKIADFGNTLIIDPQRVATTLSHMPGTSVYMPPEAMDFNPTCNTSLDIFSFGHTMLFTAIQQVPDKLLPATYMDPLTNELKPRSEVERRERYFVQLQKKKREVYRTLSGIIKQCLQNQPSKRPTARELMEMIEDLLAEHEDVYSEYKKESKMDLVRRLQSVKTTSLERSGSSSSSSLQKDSQMSELDLRAKQARVTKLREGAKGVLEVLCKVGRKKKMEWRECLVSMTPTHLQYSEVNSSKVLDKIQLKKVSEVKLIPMSSKLDDQLKFYFQVQFSGTKVSPWELRAASMEERESWMEAIKPGSTTPSHTTDSTRSPIGSASEAAVFSLSDTEDESDDDGVRYEKIPEIPQNQSTKTSPTEALKKAQQTGTDFEQLSTVPQPRYTADPTRPQAKESRRDDNFEEDTYETMYPAPKVMPELLSTVANQTLLNVSSPPAEQQQRELEQLYRPTPAPRSPRVSDTTRPRHLPTSPPPPPSSQSQDQSQMQEMLTTQLNQVLQQFVQERVAPLYASVKEVPQPLAQNTSTSQVLAPSGGHKRTLAAVPPKADTNDSQTSSEASGPVEIQPQSSEGTEKQQQQEAIKQRPVPAPRRKVSMSVSAQQEVRQDSHHVQEESSGNPYEMFIPLAENLASLQKQSLFIDPSNVEIQEEIGQGQYGKVHKAVLHRGSGNDVLVAIKTVKKYQSQKDTEDFQREMDRMLMMIHPNIVRIYGLVQQETLPWIVMEYLPNGNLKSFLTANKRPVEVLIKYMQDVAMGMLYVSEKGLVHRDLAARNIIVGENEICKISDFGLLREIPKDQTIYVSSTSTHLPIRWMAPESLRNREFSTATDIWSYGVLLWEMYQPERLPYAELPDSFQCCVKIIDGYRLKKPEAYPPMVKKIMDGCWLKDPAKRPNFHTISSLLTTVLYGGSQ